MSDYQPPSKCTEDIDGEDQRIIRFGRITAIFPSLTATDCKVYVDIDPGDLLYISEIEFLVLMASHAQNETYGERSELWIVGDLYEAFQKHLDNVEGIKAHVQGVAYKWLWHNAKMQLRKRKI